MSKARRNAILSLFFCALLWSTGGVGIKSLHITSPLVIVGYRSLVAMVFYLIVFQKRKITVRNKWFVFALISYSVMTTFYVASNLFTTAANAIILQYTAPVFVCIYTFFIFRKPLPWYDMAAVAVVLGGIIFFFLDSLSISSSPLTQFGNLLAVGSGAAYGLQAVSLGFLDIEEGRGALILGNLLNFMISLPFILTSGELPSLTDFLVISYLGIVQIGLAYVIYLKTVDKVSSLELILIPALEPILNPVWVFLLQGERPSTNAIIGGGVVIACIVIWSIYKDRRSSRMKDIEAA